MEGDVGWEAALIYCEAADARGVAEGGLAGAAAACGPEDDGGSALSPAATFAVHSL